MNRRQLLTGCAALPTAAQLHGQSERRFQLRAGLVAYSYRTQLAAKLLAYDDLIRKIADWGLDGLDCTRVLVSRYLSPVPGITAQDRFQKRSAHLQCRCPG